MTNVTTKPELLHSASECCSQLFAGWIDPLETSVRARVRRLIEAREPLFSILMRGPNNGPCGSVGRLLCGAFAHRPPPVPPAEVTQPPVRRSDCAEMPIDEQGTCRKSSQSHGFAPANIGIARRRPIGRIPPHSSIRSTAYVVFPVGSVYLGVPATFSAQPSGVLGGDWSDFFPQRLDWSDRAVTRVAARRIPASTRRENGSVLSCSAARSPFMAAKRCSDGRRFRPLSTRTIPAVKGIAFSLTLGLRWCADKNGARRWQRDGMF
jgi:hypothetical protein